MSNITVWVIWQCINRRLSQSPANESCVEEEELREIYLQGLSQAAQIVGWK